MEWFRDRKLVIATKHGKEQVIAPLLKNQLEVDIFVPEFFDTDIFGTFSGELERTLSPLEAARAKCTEAMKLTGFDLAIASEGSFGPHPSIPFINADDEVVLLVDKVNGLEIWGRHITTETNLDGATIRTKDELTTFAKRVHFPSHALILKRAIDDHTYMVKNITSWEYLMETFDTLTRRLGTIYAETDMRAMHNPMRMKAIRNATQNLLEKIGNYCPSCGRPGYWIKDIREGLPCGLCGLPTHSILANIYSCTYCGHSHEHLFPKGKTQEDPMYCNNCNP